MTHYCRPKVDASEYIEYRSLSDLSIVAHFVKARGLSFEVNDETVTIKVPRKTVHVEPGDVLVLTPTDGDGPDIWQAMTKADFDAQWEMVDLDVNYRAKTKATEPTEMTPTDIEKSLAERRAQRQAAVEVAPEDKPAEDVDVQKARGDA